MKGTVLHISISLIPCRSFIKQRDKLTGNTKSAKKKLKHAQNKFLEARIKQLERLLKEKSEGSKKDDNSVRG